MTEGESGFITKTAAQWGLSAVTLVVVVVIGYILRVVVFRRLSRWAQGTRFKVDETIVTAIYGPFMMWFVILGIYLALQFPRLPEHIVQAANKVLFVLAVGSVTLVAANIGARMITAFSGKWAAALPAASLMQTVSRIVILVIGALIILHGLGISITPILATLGVGGLAVALALQDTLSNLFAGFHIVLNRIVRVGDYIKLDSGEEGYVTDINWRTTKVRMLANNVILIPNAKLTQANVTNYYLPDKAMAVLVQVGVHYGSDLARVERITCEVGKEVMREVQGGIPEFDPFIRYHTFGDSSIQFSVILRAKEFVDQYLIKHEFVKRLHERYAKEGIVIPFPIRAINYSQEGAKPNAV